MTGRNDTIQNIKIYRRTLNSADARKPSQAPQLSITFMRVVLFTGAIFFSVSLSAFAQHPRGWTACEFKWQEAGKPADYQRFMSDCVEARGAEPRGKAISAISLDDSQQLVVRTGCRTDVCSWLRLKTKTNVQTSWRGRLLMVVTNRGISEHPGASYHRPQPVKWERSTVSYVFCSKVMPGILNKNGESWLATILAPGNPDAGPGMLRESYVEYFLICHDLNFSEEVVSDNDVRSLGYPAGLTERAGDQMKLTSPTDILDDYRSMTYQDFKLDGKELADRHTKVRLQGFYKKLEGVETLQPSALAVAAAAQYGGDNGIPLLTDDASRDIRKVFLECGDNPMRPLGCPVTVSGHVDICSAKILFSSKSVPCLVVEEGH